MSEEQYVKTDLLPEMAKKALTLVYFRKDDKVLLALKKRRFGAGLWNGYGGKQMENETIEESAKREALEESGMTVEEMVSRGVLYFTFEGNPQMLAVHVFLVTKYSGEPVETDEMKPQWFAFNEIPYDKMWPNDKIWLPKFLAGENVHEYYHFTADGTTILKHEVKEKWQG